MDTVQNITPGSPDDTVSATPSTADATATRRTAKNATAHLVAENVQQKSNSATSSSSDAVNLALNTTASNLSDTSSAPQQYIEDNSQSAMQSSKNKSGWCFIGAGNEYRTCAKVGVSDTCMSGDIFPTQELCMNPSLRE